MERYQRIYLDDRQHYIANSNIIISACAILKDNEKNTILGQAKFQNIGNKAISALIVSVLCYDVLGNEIERIANYQYLDLNVKRDEFFGVQNSIPISNSNARKIQIVIEQIVYANGTNIMLYDKECFEMPKVEVLSTDSEIMKQAQIEFGKAAKYKYMEYHDLWFCTCGKVNGVGENYCHACGVAKNKLLSASLSYLIEKKKERVAKEIAEEAERRQKEEEELHKKQEQTRRRTKKMIIAGSIIMCVSLLTFLFKYIYTNQIVPSGKYEKAEEFVKSEDYDSAIEIYSELGDYKDSEKKLYEVYYVKANACFEAGKYDDALAIYEIVSKKQNVEQEIYNCKNGKAINLFEEGKYEEARSLFTEISNEEYITKIDAIYLEQKKENGKKQLEELVDVTAYQNREQITINTQIAEGKERISKATSQQEVDDIINEYKISFASIKTTAQYEEENKVNTTNSSTALKSGRTIDDSLLYGSWKFTSESGNYRVITYNGNTGSDILYSVDGTIIESIVGTVSWKEGNWLVITGEKIFFGKNNGVHESWIEIGQLTSTSFYCNMYGYFYKQ